MHRSTGIKAHSTFTLVSQAGCQQKKKKTRVSADAGKCCACEQFLDVYVGCLSHYKMLKDGKTICLLNNISSLGCSSAQLFRIIV